jgi:alpha-1,6-mannosyltransferase
MRPVLLAAGLCWVAFCAAGTIAPGDLVAWELLAALPWAGGLLLLRRRMPRRRDLPLILGLAVLGRAVLLVAPPVLSDDVHRYLWDGRVQRAGFDPYAHAPAAPELAGLRDEGWAMINHRDVPTVYPPLAELGFRAVTALWPSPIGFRALAVLFDVGTSLLLAVLLRRRGVDARAVIVFAWSPLAAVEAAVGGHVDAPAIALFVAALLLLERGRWFASGILAGLSLSTKLGAAALLPLLARGRRAAILAGLCVGLAPFLWHAGGPLMPGLGEYARRWRHNASLFVPLEAAAGALAGDQPRVLSPRAARVLSGRDRDRVYPDEVAAAWARGVAAALWLGLAAVVVVRRLDVFRGGLVLLAGAFLLSPVVHPWYVTWLLPLLCIAPFSPLLLFVALVPLGYTAPTGLRVLEYGIPALAALVWLSRRPPGRADAAPR